MLLRQKGKELRFWIPYVHAQPNFWPSFSSNVCISRTLSLYLIGGTSTSMYQVFNFSTGRIIHKIFFDSEVTSMDYAHTGQLMFCGDATVCHCIYLFQVPFWWACISFYWYSPLYNSLQGCIYSVSMNSHTGVLSRSHRHRSSIRRKSAVTTVQYRSFSMLARGPVLLTCTQDGSLSFFRFGHRTCLVTFVVYLKHWQQDWYVVVLLWKYRVIWLSAAHSN